MMIELLLGHLAGDYLLQNEFMATNKRKSGWNGWSAILSHCILYTATVMLFTWDFRWYWIAFIFFSHFLIDRFAVVEWYMERIKGRSIDRYLNLTPSDPMGVNPQYNVLIGSLTMLVYVVVDNTMHLILMWGFYKVIN